MKKTIKPFPLSPRWSCIRSAVLNQIGMNHGSLFSGIGGFDLAAQWMGWENVFHCEWNDFGRKVFNHYWPNAISYGDITKTDFSIHRGSIDILTGGFPCQPYSTAGKRLGKEDDRHLWPEMLRAIREIQPRFIVGENVSGIVSWNGGLVFEEVQTDLEAEGYEVQTVILPACGVNAPHKRNRVWFVAYSGCNVHPRKLEHREDRSKARRSERGNKKQGNSSHGERIRVEFGASSKDVTNTNDKRLERHGEERTNKKRKNTKGHARSVLRTWDKWPTQSPICSRNDGLSIGLDGITFPKWRKESIKAYGNAIVPQLVYQIFRALELSHP